MKPGKKADRIERIKSVERQLLVAVKAIESLEVALKDHSNLLTNVGLKTADLRAFKSQLLDTYFIRLFAEFETALKDYWKNYLKQDHWTRIMDVIDSLAARQRVVDSLRMDVHHARKWRNKLVHEDNSDATEVELATARRSFGKFIGRLDDEW